MLPIRTLYICAFALALATSAHAQDSKISKAESVVDAFLVIDGQSQVKLAVDDLLRQTQEYQFRPQYEEFFATLVSSPEYRAAKTKAFAQAFSEDELSEILVLAQSPIFRKYQERTPELQKASRIAFAESMRPKFFEFARKIEALKIQRQTR